MKRIVYAAIAVLAAVSCTSGRYHWSEDSLIAPDGSIVGQASASANKGIGIRTKTEKVAESTFKVTFTFTADEDVEDARLNADFIHSSHSDYWMLPAVSYNGNWWGKGLEPKGAGKDGRWRTYSYRRSPIPGAIYSEGERHAVATWSDVPQCSQDDFSYSVMPEDSATTHRLVWPEEELPDFYCNRDKYDQGWRRSASMKAGESRSLIMYVDVTGIEPQHKAVSHFLKQCWNSMEHPHMAVPDYNAVWDLGTRFFKKSLWAEEGIFKGFSIGLLPGADGNWFQRPGGRYESGWCGQNISASCSLLWDYLKHGDKESLEKGLATLDCWADNCRLPNGLFITQFDPILDGGECRIDACNLGTSAMNFLVAEQLAKECGHDRPQYRELALAALDFVMADQQDNGCYARGWTYDGECIFREGTVGMFMVPPMIDAYSITGEQKYLDSALKAYEYYFSELRNDGYTTAGALDTWCIDKESSVSLIRSAIRMYKLSGEQRYLDDAVMVSYYLSTWMWHYDGIYPEDDSFSINDFHTFGGTSVSTQHHHLDVYACLWTPEWVELAELTGDSQWREKADAIWAYACQKISDGTTAINGRVRPAGGQNEACFENYWGFSLRQGESAEGLREAPSSSRQDRLNDWLVAWPSAFRLEAMRRMDVI